MTIWNLLVRGLWHQRRAHFGLVMGVGVTCAVLIGALMVGDSVRFSLARIASDRLGTIAFAMKPRDLYFREALAAEMAEALDTAVVPAIQLTGVVAKPGGGPTAPHTRVFGVPDTFWALAGRESPFENAAKNEVVINRKLAAKLDIEVGDFCVLRVEKPSLLPRDAVIAAAEQTQLSMRLKIAAIIDADRFGNFNLDSSQLAPANLFFRLEDLQWEMEREGSANLLLVAGSRDASLDAQTVEAALKAHWQPEDAAITVRYIEAASLVEMRTGRVFFPTEVGQRLAQLQPGATRIFSYFVNSIGSKGRETPYSMVAAIAEDDNAGRSGESPRLAPLDLADDEIMVNQWCWDDLGLESGEQVKLTYFVVDQAHRLAEQEAIFKVRGPIPMTGGGLDPGLVPEFEGMTDADHCRDWDTGIPIELSKIRDKDEAYWEQYGATPKAVISLASGQRIWRNRFGNLTAIRYAAAAGAAAAGVAAADVAVADAAAAGAAVADAAAAGAEQTSPLKSDEMHDSVARMRRLIRQNLEPGEAGLFFLPVGEMAERARNQGMDFGGLFIGFSLFLVLAALLLTWLLFVFSLEQRLPEMGTLRALGFRRAGLRSLYSGEALLLCIPGVLFGLLFGLLYSRGVIQGLLGLWRDAVGDWPIVFDARPGSIVFGATAGVLASLVTVYMSMRRFAKFPVTSLLAGELAEPEEERRLGLRPYRTIAFALLSLAAATVFVVLSVKKGGTSQAGLFFLAGALVLTGLLAFFNAFLTHLGRVSQNAAGSATGLAIRYLARRRGRGLAVAAMLACGSFLVVSLESQRQDAANDAFDIKSGTGGYALIGNTTQPVYKDLNTLEGRTQFGLESDDLDGGSFVAMRVLDGDDASCLNLNRAQQPALFAIDPRIFGDRGAFTFAAAEKGKKASPWLLLGERSDPDVVPAIGDLNTLTYSLGLKVGDELDYRDEQGEPFKLRIVAALANSIFQGSLLIDESQFLRRYPSQAGYRQFLVDVAPDRMAGLTLEINQAMGDVGMDIMPTAEWLNGYNRVQNTYISIFQLLGGLGLILGSFGMAVVVLRNVAERRPELALLRAVGFPKWSIGRMVLIEHLLLLVAGLGIGCAAAWVALLPRLLEPGTAIPWTVLGGLAAVLALSGGFWTFLATYLALEGELTEALRKE